MKTFSIGNDRSLKFSKNEIVILDKCTKKAAVFTPNRWASFVQCLDEIDNQLQKMSQDEDVAYCSHYGGGWHASVTKGFRCVDLRKWWLPSGQTVCKPTKSGIAIRLSEWPTFKQAVQHLHRDNPTVANFTPCFLNQDHTTQQAIAACEECNPFRLIVA